MAKTHPTQWVSLHNIRPNLDIGLSINPIWTPILDSLSLIFHAVQKSGRGPGIFYHVSDVEGREDLIERRRIVDVPTPVVA